MMHTGSLPAPPAANAARWIARQDIQAGEMVTTSYLMRNDALPAPMRQALLEKSYWFKCRCQA